MPVWRGIRPDPVDDAANVDLGGAAFECESWTSNATLRVRFDGGATGFSAGERVEVIGKVAAVANKCTIGGPAASPVLRTIVIHPAGPSNA